MPVPHVWLLCGFSNTTARRIGTYQKRHTAYKKLLLMMDWYSPKHVQRILKIKTNHKNFVRLAGYIHIVRWRTVHTMSNWFYRVCKTWPLQYEQYNSVSTALIGNFSGKYYKQTCSKRNVHPVSWRKNVVNILLKTERDIDTDKKKILSYKWLRVSGKTT